MPGVLPLTILCENVLLHNHFQLRDLGDTRYDLVKRVLMKCSAQQIMNLESSNPKLVLEDENIWFNLLQKQFPQDVHERFTTNSQKILQFFKQQLEELGFDHSSINLNNHLNIVTVGNNIKKYRLPSKLLFLKYTEDHMKKEELAIENLRQRIKSIQESKEMTKTIQIDRIVPHDRPKQLTRNKPERSKLFQKSHSEARKYRENFKNPLSNIQKRVIHQPQERSTSPPLSYSLIPKSTSVPSKVSNSVQKVTKPMSPIKHKNVSIFLTKRPIKPSTKRSQSPPVTPNNNNTKNNNTSTPSASNTTDDASTTPTTTTNEQRQKRIKLGDYISRMKN